MMTARGAATRGRLIEAAAELVAQEGYAGASVAAVARRAGVAAGALYRHFPSKAELFVELFREVAEQELAAMYAASSARDSYVDKLDAVLTTYATRALTAPRLTWALVYEPVDPLVDAERLAFRRRFCDEMADLLREAIRAGELPEQSAELTAAAVVGAVAEALVGPISPVSPRRAETEETIAEIVRLCRRAAGT